MNMLPNIKVIGIGGAGCNAVSRMVSCKIQGVEFIAANTDAQDLRKTHAHKKIRLGRTLTKGLGTGMDPALGREAAKESQDELQEVLRGADMLFITCGLGGGTGTGGSAVVADIAKSMGILTLAFVTQPFSFEGGERKRVAEQGIADLQGKVDTLLAIPNDKIFEVCDHATPLRDAFWMLDELLRQAVQGISDLILAHGFINVDFADVRSIMRHGGQAVFGVGRACGDGRAQKAAERATSSPFLDFSIEGSKGVLFTIAAKDDIALSEVTQASNVVMSKVDPRARVIFGAVRDPRLKKGEVKITVVATRFGQKSPK